MGGMITQAIPPQILGDPQSTPLLTSKNDKKSSLLPSGGDTHVGLHVKFTVFSAQITFVFFLGGSLKIARGAVIPLKNFRGFSPPAPPVSQGPAPPPKKLMN